MTPDQSRPPREPVQPGHRVRLSRKKGTHLPPGTIKADRTTLLGNPFKVGEPNGLGWGVVEDAQHAVWLHRQWLATPARSIVYEADRHAAVLRRLPALAGRNLACWCVLGSPCHVDTLLELAARPDIAEVVDLLLGGWSAPPSPMELAVAAGQLGHLTGMQPDEVSNLGSTVVALLDEQRTRA